MSGETWIVRNRETAEFFLKFFREEVFGDSGEVIGKWSVTLKPYTDPRSLSQNATFWMWCDQMAKEFTRRDYPLSKQGAHDLMCHLFLGYETVTLGETEITSLRTTTWPTKLEKGEMQHFMEQVDAWAVDKRVYLKTPGFSDYEKWRSD